MFSCDPKLGRLTEFLWLNNPVSALAVVWSWVCDVQQEGWLYSPSLGLNIDELSISPNRSVLPKRITNYLPVSWTWCLLLHHPGTAALLWRKLAGFDRLRTFPRSQLVSRLCCSVTTWTAPRLQRASANPDRHFGNSSCRGKKLQLWERLPWTINCVCHWILLQFLAFARNIQCHREILILIFSPPIIIINASSTVCSSAFVFWTDSSLI